MDVKNVRNTKDAVFCYEQNEPSEYRSTPLGSFRPFQIVFSYPSCPTSKKRFMPQEMRRFLYNYLLIFRYIRPKPQYAEYARRIRDYPQKYSSLFCQIQERIYPMWNIFAARRRQCSITNRPMIYFPYNITEKNFYQ